MLRRLLAALLVAAFAMPLPAVAVASAKSCPMKEHAGLAADHRCCCNEAAPAASNADRESHRSCAKPAAAKSGCDCVVKADPGRQPVAPAATSSDAPVKSPAPLVLLLPASMSTPQRRARAVPFTDPPPAAGLVSRPLLCTWTL